MNMEGSPISEVAMAFMAAAVAVAQQAAQMRAERLKRAAQASDADRNRTLAWMRTDANLQSTRWEAARRQGLEWPEAYASAVSWRDLDPRAARAADEIEAAMASHEFLNVTAGQQPQIDPDQVRSEVRAAQAAGWDTGQIHRATSGPDMTVDRRSHVL